MKNLSIKQMEKMACTIRQDVVKMLLKAGSGHAAGSLGMADVFTALYFSGVAKYNPKKPDWSERDRIVLSNAHICPVQYAALARAGYFPVKELGTLRKLGSQLQGHSHRMSTPGVENSGGPIAHGTSMAVGMAYAGRYLVDGYSLGKIENLKISDRPGKPAYQVYCLIGDGGQNEGMMWESIMFASKYKLDNLTYIMDRNYIQIDGYTEDVMPLEPLKAKYEAFNWHVIEVDGHNIEAIVDAINQAKAVFGKPVLIICHTIPGKGVDFIEWQYSWHGKTPNKEETQQALHQLRTLGGKIKSEDE